MNSEWTAVLGQLVEKVNVLATKVDIETLRTELKADIAAVDCKVDSLRQVTSANHFKVIGRIDQVASMLADHMAQHDHPPVRGGAAGNRPEIPRRLAISFS